MHWLDLVAHPEDTSKSTVLAFLISLSLSFVIRNMEIKQLPLEGYFEDDMRNYMKCLAQHKYST